MSKNICSVRLFFLAERFNTKKKQRTQSKDAPGREARRSRKATETETPLAAARYNHALSLLSPKFLLLSDQLAGVTVIKAADAVIRDDATSFLLDELPRWDGPWIDTSLPRLVQVNSTINRFVNISQRLNQLERQVPTEGLLLRLHRVLQYQLYCQFEREVADAKPPKAKGMKNSTLAMELCLARLFSDDWDKIGQKEKMDRRDRLHNQKTVGKRLQMLCDNLGYGILLLGSRSSVRSM
jgi:hypothetical protein